MRSRNIIFLATALSISFPITSMANNHSAKPTVEQAQSEGKILETVIVLNKNEIAAGNLALKKSSNKEVKNFAAFMVKEHGDNLKKTEMLSHKLGVNPASNSTATNLKHKGKKELAHLKTLHGTSFDKAYMDAMVKGHEDALNLINNLISQASNPLVKKHLEATKVHVEHHLQKAQAIQKTLG